MKAPEQRTPIDSQLIDTVAVRVKVEHDIAFLTDRIGNIERQSNPNKIILDTYNRMLQSRLSVLKWLMHGSYTDDAVINIANTNNFSPFDTKPSNSYTNQRSA